MKVEVSIRRKKLSLTKKEKKLVGTFLKLGLTPIPIKNIAPEIKLVFSDDINDQNLMNEIKKENDKLKSEIQKIEKDLGKDKSQSINSSIAANNERGYIG